MKFVEQDSCSVFAFFRISEPGRNSHGCVGCLASFAPLPPAVNDYIFFWVERVSFPSVAAGECRTNLRFFARRRIFYAASVTESNGGHPPCPANSLYALSSRCITVIAAMLYSRGSGCAELPVRRGAALRHCWRLQPRCRYLCWHSNRCRPASQLAVSRVVGSKRGVHRHFSRIKVLFWFTFVDDVMTGMIDSDSIT